MKYAACIALGVIIGIAVTLVYAALGAERHYQAQRQGFDPNGEG